MHGNHFKHMLIGGAAVIGVLVLAGVPLASALPYAALLACPLMMVFMMSSTGGHGAHGDHREEHVRADRQPSGEAPSSVRPQTPLDNTPRG